MLIIEFLPVFLGNCIGFWDTDAYPASFHQQGNTNESKNNYDSVRSLDSYIFRAT